jgi:hypothetical protein
MFRHDPVVRIEGAAYCVDSCLEPALRQAVERVQTATRRVPAAHRIPLGLLLLSRQQLTAEQLRAALEAQRSAGCGRIGEWLQKLGFVSEEQVTAALARQWSCPVLLSSLLARDPHSVPQVPAALLRWRFMLPVAFVKASSTLHVAFGDALDYVSLYALEQMLGCRTEPCLVSPTRLRSRLECLPVREQSQAVFDHLTEIAEIARTIRSYAAHLSASEVRLTRCGPHLWVRLLRTSRPPFDLLVRSLPDSTTLSSTPALAG